MMSTDGVPLVRHVHLAREGTLTDLNRKRFEEMPEELEDMVSHIALGHPATPADFGGIAVLLASDASNHLNGAVIPVDGGESCL